MYTIDYFIEKFEAIPEEQWVIYATLNSKGQRCALGHCEVIENNEHGRYILNQEAEALISILMNVLPKNIKIYERSDIVTNINDNKNSGFGETPKERILNALKKAKELQQQDRAVQQVQEIANQSIAELI